jgi:hypothetical protein
MRRTATGAAGCVGVLHHIWGRKLTEGTMLARGDLQTGMRMQRESEAIGG